MSAFETERELLELAAKALGIPGAWSEQHRAFHIAEHLRGPSDEARAARAALGLSTASRICWAPLDDDGDALRLAVALQAAKGPGWVISLSIGASQSACEFEYAGGADVATNTRRAIVIAAAVIGRAMP